MGNEIWLAICPSAAFLVAVAVAIWQPWKRPGRHNAPVIGGPVPAHPRPAEHDDTTTLIRPADVGSMDRTSEWAWRNRGPLRAELAELAEVLNYPPRAYACGECGAPDYEPHYESCSYYSPQLSELTPEQYAQVRALPPMPGPVEIRAGALHPAAWRPFLTETEWAELFPGVDYDPGPHTGDVLASDDPAQVDRLDQANAEHAAWMTERAQAHLALRASLLAAWQALACS